VAPRSAILAVLAATGLPACSFGADFDGGRFRCDTAADCPAGLACSHGYCAAGGEPDSDAATPPPDGSTGGCAPLAGFTDDFSDAASWEPFGATSALCRAAIEDGRAVLSKEDQGPPCGLRSRDRYDLDGGDVWVELIDFENLPVAGFEVGGDAGWLGVFLLDAFELSVIARSSADSTDLDSALFNPYEDIFWRLSLAGDRFEWFTSSDGFTWDTKGSGELPDGFSLDCARVQLRVEGDAGAVGDTIRFDNLNLAP